MALGKSNCQLGKKYRLFRAILFWRKIKSFKYRESGWFAKVTFPCFVIAAFFVQRNKIQNCVLLRFDLAAPPSCEWVNCWGVVEHDVMILQNFLFCKKTRGKTARSHQSGFYGKDERIPSIQTNAFDKNFKAHFLWVKKYATEEAD